MNYIFLYKKFAGLLSKLKLGKFQTIVNIHEEILSYLSSFKRADFMEIDGQKIFLDKEDSLMLSIKNNDHEKFETACVKKMIKEGDTVLDLGANIGYYTLIFAKMVGKKGKVFAFEPESNNFELLKKNIDINKHSNVTPIQKAVSDKNGTIKMYISKRNLASHRIFDAGDKRKTIEVGLTTLDEYFKNYEKPINFIKMDIEGVEGAAILGATTLIEKSNDLTIMMEYFPKFIKKFGMNPEDVLQQLVKMNFKLYHINNLNKKLEPIEISDFIKQYNEEKQNYTNLLCIRGKNIEFMQL